MVFDIDVFVNIFVESIFSYFWVGKWNFSTDSSLLEIIFVATQLKCLLLLPPGKNAIRRPFTCITED